MAEVARFVLRFFGWAFTTVGVFNFAAAFFVGAGIAYAAYEEPSHTLAAWFGALMLVGSLCLLVGYALLWLNERLPAAGSEEDPR